MTEPIEPIEPTPAEPTEPDGSSNVVDEDSGDDDAVLDPKMKAHLHKLRQEAQTLRSRALTAEADRERLLTQAEAARRREVERHAEPYLVDTSDIWRAPDTAAFIDEQFGEVIGDRVREAAQAIIEQKPHLARPPQSPPPTDRPIEGLRPGARAEEKRSAPSWASALRGT